MIPIRPEEYQVWSQCLIGNAQFGRVEQHVIRETIRCFTLLMPARRDQEPKLNTWRVHLRGLSAETLEDFINVNSELGRLEPHFDVSRPCVLLSDAGCDEIWQKQAEHVSTRISDGWKRFHERFPKSGGLVSFSRVGLNPARSQAAVEFGVQADGRMGYGAALFLQRDAANHCVIQGKHGLWIS
jgi:hypothetical protein